MMPSLSRHALATRATVVLAALLLTVSAMAQGQSAKIDTGDTSWILVATALVMLMTPGLALFYGGMVRRKNVLGTMMQSLMCLAVISLQWVLFGYTLAFSPSLHGIIGGLSWFGLRGVGADPNVGYAATIPHMLFMAFQMMFAIITPALIFGSVAERLKFKAFLIFLPLWATLIYDPLAHWVWGIGGWLRGLGALDFAGGLVVHISAGTTALVAALLLGRRRGYPHEPMQPHNLTMTIIGAALLWFGWFGFNAGSALGANGLAVNAFVTTNTAAAAAALAWVIIEWLKQGKPTMLGAASGAVAGLVAITPAAGYVEPWAAIVIGLIAGFVCYLAVNLKYKLGYDDSLDAFGVHGVGGIIGALLTGIFATKIVNAGVATEGLAYSHSFKLLGIQAVAVLIVMVFCGLASFLLFKAVSLVSELRLSRTAEIDGMDHAEHGEKGYHLGDLPSGQPRTRVPIINPSHVPAPTPFRPRAIINNSSK